MFLGGSKGNIRKERVKIERPCSIIFLAVQKCTIYFYPVLLYLLQSFVFFLLSATIKIFEFLKIAGNTRLLNLGISTISLTLQVSTLSDNQTEVEHGEN